MSASGKANITDKVRRLADARLPQRVRAALEALLRTTSSEFEHRLQAMLEELEQQLFRLADHARNPGHEGGYLQTLRTMRLNQADLIPRFLAEVEASLANLEQRVKTGASQAAAAAESVGDFSRLSLVEEANMDLELVQREIAQRCASNASLPLHFLGLRFGVLAGAPAFDAEQLPLGPFALCEALQHASASLQLEQEFQLLLLRTFERKVMVDYTQIAERLNAELVTAGILPVLTYVPVRRQGSAGTRARRARQATETEADTNEQPAQQDAPQAAPPEPAPFAAPSAPQGPAQPAAPRPQRTGAHPFATWMASPPETALKGARSDPSFSMLQDLLAHHRSVGSPFVAASPDPAPQAAGAGAAGPQPAGKVVVPAPEAVDSALGQVRSAMALSNGNVATTIDGIREQVVQRLRDAHGPAAGLSQSDNDTFDLLGMLYDRIEREVRVDTLAAALLRRLQVPVVQTALKDQAFFSEPNHPARELLGTVADSGAKWFGQVDVDPALMQAIRRAVEHVVRHAHEDPTAFEASNRVLQTELQQQARRSEIAERRHVEAARGKEKLQIAKDAAAETIANLLGKSKPPRFVRALLEQAWADVLTLSALRNGRDSEEWDTIVATTQRIVAASCSSKAKPDPGLAEEVETALTRVGYHADEAKAISQRLTGVQGEDDNASRTELAATLKARARLGEQQGAKAKKKETVTPRTPEEEAQYDRIRVLPFGTWIEFTTNQQGDVVRKRLSWYSTITGNALFVNLRGQRIGEQSLDSLARMFARGQARVVTIERARVIDRAWQATLAALRGLGVGKARKTPAWTAPT